MLDDAFGDVDRDVDGVATATVRDPASGLGVALWMDDGHHWLQVFSADDGSDRARCALAVEPMTALRTRSVPAATWSPSNRLATATTSSRPPGGFARFLEPDQRRAVKLGSLSGAGTDPHAPPPEDAASTERSSRSAAWARSPSEPWMPIAETAVPSARSRVTHGAPGRQVRVDHLGVLELAAAVAVDHDQPVGLGHHPGAHQREAAG